MHRRCNRVAVFGCNQHLPWCECPLQGIQRIRSDGNSSHLTVKTKFKGIQKKNNSAILLNSLYRLQLGRCQLHSSSNINLFLFVFVPKCSVQIQLIALACLDSLVPCQFAFRHSMASLSRLEDKKRCGLCGERTWFWKLFRWKTRTPGAFQRFLSKMQQIQSTRRYIRYIQLQFFTYIKLQCISLYNMHESMNNDEKWIFARQAASNLKDFHFDCFEMGRATAIGDAVKVFSKRTPVRLSWTKWRRLWVLVVKWLRRFWDVLRRPGPCGVGLDVQTCQPGTLAASRGTESKDFGSLGATAGHHGCGVRIDIRSIRKDMYSSIVL